MRSWGSLPQPAPGRLSPWEDDGLEDRFLGLIEGARQIFVVKYPSAPLKATEQPAIGQKAQASATNAVRLG
jgi:hypothetical protein